MRDLIDLVEAPFVRRTTNHVPFGQVTPDMVCRAMVDASDLRDVLEAGRWEDMFDDLGDDEQVPPIPRASEQLAPDHLALMVDYYREAFAETHQMLAPIAGQAEIPIHRRLSRLSDLSQPLGVHWSHGAEAYEHMSDFGEHVVFGTVSPNEVDWVTTFGRAIFWWSSEREITPVAGTAIKLTHLTFGNEAVGRA